DADDTKRRHKVERAVPVRKLSRSEVVPEVERLDLLLFGGGGILYDADARTYLREVLVAKEHGVPVMLYAVGAGPLADPNVQMARSVLGSQHSHAVIAKMLRAQRARVLNGEYTSGQLLSLMGHFSFAVGMRLHFLVFAALRGVPFVALPYAGKVAGFLEDLKLPAPPLNPVNPGPLCAHLDG